MILFWIKKTFPSSKEVSEMFEIEYLKKGGHASFISGNTWKQFGWIETKIIKFFKNI